MTFTRRIFLLVALVLPISATANAGEKLVHREWTIDGVTREALVYIPAESKTPAPLVFAFHGHGGSSKNAATMFRIHELWPEAIVVYPQGVNTPGQLTDPDGKKPGWQHARGDYGDRDLKFFDAMLASVHAEQKVDDARVFVTGHSNGGGYTYLLWATRGEHITAVAPSGALDRESVRELKPKPCLHIAGKNDPLVKFEWQQRMINAVLAINECDTKGATTKGDLTTYTSKNDAPTETYLYDGGHKFPSEAPQVIVDFFKSLPAKPTATKTASP